MAKAVHATDSLCRDRPKIQRVLREDLEVNCKKCIKLISAAGGKIGLVAF